MSHLILPDGLHRKRNHELGEEQMAWLAMAEDVLPSLHMTIMCLRCRTPIRGENDPTDATIRVDCACRTLTYRARAKGTA